MCSSEQKYSWKVFCFKFTMGTILIVSSKTKLGFGTASVLFPTLITFYKHICELTGIELVPPAFQTTYPQ